MPSVPGSKINSVRMGMCVLLILGLNGEFSPYHHNMFIDSVPLPSEDYNISFCIQCSLTQYRYR
jgi:hypothetical protein